MEPLNVYAARLFPRENYLTPGHRACQGCGEVLAVRLVHQVLGRRGRGDQQRKDEQHTHGQCTFRGGGCQHDQEQHGKQTHRHAARISQAAIRVPSAAASGSLGLAAMAILLIWVRISGIMR